MLLTKREKMKSRVRQVFESNDASSSAGRRVCFASSIERVNRKVASSKRARVRSTTKQPSNFVEIRDRDNPKLELRSCCRSQ